MPMLGLHGLDSGLGSFSPALQGLGRLAIDTVLLYNCPTLFLIAGGTAPCRRSQDVDGGRPSLARESGRASLPADSWLYHLQEPIQRIRHADPQLCCVACSDTEHAIICGEKDVDRRLLGTSEMEGIIGAKPQSLQFLRTCDSDIRQRDRVMRPAEH